MSKKNQLLSVGKWFPLTLAWIYFSDRKQNKVISWLSVFSSVSFILGIAILVLVLSITNGFQHILLDRLVNTSHHLTIERGHYRDAIDWKAIEEILNQFEEVTAISLVYQTDALLKSEYHNAPIQLLGIDPLSYSQVVNFNEYMSNEGLDALYENNHHLIVGKGLVDSLWLLNEDWVQMYYPSQQKQSFTSKVSDFQVVDFFKVDYIQDYYLSFLTKDAFESLNILFEEILVVRVKSPFEVEKFKLLVEKTLNHNYEGLLLLTWENEFSELLMAIGVEKILMISLMMFLICIAMFGVVSILFLFVQEKLKDIFVLKTYGFSNKIIARVFIFYGFILTTLGSVLGTLLGLLLSVIFSDFVKMLQTLFQQNFLENTFYSEVPIEINLLEIMSINFFFLIIAYSIIKITILFLLKKYRVNDLLS